MSKTPNVKDIFDSATPEDLERLVPFLYGEELANRIKVLAHGRSKDLIGMIQESMHMALDHGVFDALGATEKRTGNDERADYALNIQIKAVVGAGNYVRLCDVARLRMVSNQAALRMGTQWALERNMF